MPNTTEHVREAATGMDDGTLLADCSCGAEYAVPQGGNEYDALEAAHAAHVRKALGMPEETGEQP